jgi:hypothetical protein
MDSRPYGAREDRPSPENAVKLGVLTEKNTLRELRGQAAPSSMAPKFVPISPYQVRSPKAAG